MERETRAPTSSSNANNSSLVDSLQVSRSNELVDAPETAKLGNCLENRSQNDKGSEEPAVTLAARLLMTFDVVRRK